jgi:energy-coupling factor transporter ATP-binding protein EcfA2
MEQAKSSILSFVDMTPFVDKELRRIGEKTLVGPQIAVLKASWLGLTYQQMSEQTPYTTGYLQCDVAPLLWSALSKAFGRKIGKRTFRPIIESLFEQADEADSQQGRSNYIGKPPETENFVGRQSELHYLSSLIAENQCVLVVGPAGIGKSSLVSKLFHQQKSCGNFEYAIWKYCSKTHPSEDIQDFQQLLNIKHPNEIISFLRSHRCLICFDEIDIWLKENFSEAEDLIRNYIDTDHNSVFLFTSREPLPLIERLIFKGRSAKSVLIEGLTAAETQILVKSYGLSVSISADLHKKYDGNPMCLHQASLNISSIYGGKIDGNLDSKSSLAGGFYRESLNSIFQSNGSQIKELERFVLAQLVWMAGKGEIKAGEATNNIVKLSAYSRTDVLHAINTLQGRSLIKLDKTLKPPHIIVPDFVQKYVQLNVDNIFPQIQEQSAVS